MKLSIPLLRLLLCGVTLGILSQANPSALAASKPMVSTEPAREVGLEQATLHALVNPKGATTQTWFQFAAGDTNYTLATP